NQRNSLYQSPFLPLCYVLDRTSPGLFSLLRSINRCCHLRMWCCSLPSVLLLPPLLDLSIVFHSPLMGNHKHKPMSNPIYLYCLSRPILCICVQQTICLLEL